MVGVPIIDDGILQTTIDPDYDHLISCRQHDLKTLKELEPAHYIHKKSDLGIKQNCNLSNSNSYFISLSLSLSSLATSPSLFLSFFCYLSFSLFLSFFIYLFFSLFLSYCHYFYLSLFLSNLLFCLSDSLPICLSFSSSLYDLT